MMGQRRVCGKEKVCGKQRFVPLMLHEHLCFILEELLNAQTNGDSDIWSQADGKSAILISGIFCMEHRGEQRVQLTRRRWNGVFSLVTDHEDDHGGHEPAPMKKKKTCEKLEKK